MSDRLNSIRAMRAAANRLTESCEAALRGPPRSFTVDGTRPEHAGTVRALRTALRELGTTPGDMAATLRRAK